MNKLISGLHKSVVASFYKSLSSSENKVALVKIDRIGSFTTLDDFDLSALSKIISGNSRTHSFKLCVHVLSFLSDRCLLAKQQMSDYKETVALLLEENDDIIQRRCLNYNVGDEGTEDFSQDFYFKLLKALPSYDPDKSNFRTWMSYMVNNALIDKHRRRDRMVADDDICFDKVVGDDNISMFTREDISRFCDKALRTLNEDERLVVEGRYGFSGSDVMTYNELSSLTGIPSSSIRLTTAPAALDKLRVFSKNFALSYF